MCRFQVRSSAGSLAIKFDLPQSFDLIALRVHCTALRDTSLSPNFLRGQFGKALHHLDPAAYEHWFAPHSDQGPSGLRDSPRAFVIRARETRISAGSRFDFALHLFDVRPGSADLAIRAFETIAPIDSITARDPLRFPLEPAHGVSQIRIDFLTPTELKNADRPDFAILFARLRDRISTLRARYQSGPLEIDFKAMAERAAAIRMTRCEIGYVESERTSRSTGQRHPLSGFTGFAEYEGELGEFMPYLEIGRYTGVGRQTVWGKGEIHAVVA